MQRSIRGALRSIMAGAVMATVMATGALCAEPEPVSVSIAATGGDDAYSAAAEAICEALAHGAAEDDGGQGVSCSRVAVAGPAASLDKLREGTVDFAVVPSDWQYHAANGTGPYVDKPFEALRAVMAVHAEPFQVVAAGQAAVSSWADLAGKRVSVGEPGSGQWATFDAVLAANGGGADFFGDAVELPAEAQAEALCSGAIDAFGVRGAVPDAGIVKAVGDCGARLVPLEGEWATFFVQDNPFYADVAIAQASYPGLSGDVLTLGVFAILVTRADVADGVVNALTRAVFENLESLRSGHAAFADLEKSGMTSNGLTARFHPGAIDYFFEAGLF